jgi:hypothetical protein
MSRINHHQRPAANSYSLPENHLPLQFVNSVGGSSPDGVHVKEDMLCEAFGGGSVENWIAAGEVTGLKSDKFGETGRCFGIEQSC